MKTYSIYNLSTGIFTGNRITASEKILEQNVSEGLGAIEGVHDNRNKIVDLESLLVVDWSPPRPSDNDFVTWSWSESDRLWISDPTPAAIAAGVRKRRDALLAECDWVATRAAETGQKVPEDWAAYRAALRNITKSEGFPGEISWPAAPN